MHIADQAIGFLYWSVATQIRIGNLCSKNEVRSSAWLDCRSKTKACYLPACTVAWLLLRSMVWLLQEAMLAENCYSLCRRAISGEMKGVQNQTSFWMPFFASSFHHWNAFFFLQILMVVFLSFWKRIFHTMLWILESQLWFSSSTWYNSLHIYV